MSIEVIPAIDVLGGRLARLRGGDASTLREHKGDPVELAERFIEQGARWIHFVDLDAALGGHAANLGLLSRIAALPVRVQAGGGLTRDEAAAALEAGADRAVVGAAVITDAEELSCAVEDLGAHVAVALDVRDGRVAPRGRAAAGTPEVSLEEALGRLAAAGAVRVVYTDVSRDGALRGPDLAGLRAVAERFGGAVIASGGIRSRDDVDAVAGAGAEAAIVGTALYEAGLNLGEVLRGVR